MSDTLRERRRVLDILDSVTIGSYFPREYKSAVETILGVIRDEVASGRECCALCDDDDEPHHTHDPIAALAGAT